MLLTRRKSTMLNRLEVDDETQTLLQSRAHTNRRIPYPQHTPSQSHYYFCTFRSLRIVFGVIFALTLILSLSKITTYFQNVYIIHEVTQMKVPDIIQQHINLTLNTPNSESAEITKLKQEISKLKVPDFLIIGVLKSGSTSLYHYLLHHPQITGVNATYLLPESVRNEINSRLFKRNKNGSNAPRYSRNISRIIGRMVRPIIDQKEVRYFDRFWYQNLPLVTGNGSTLLGWKWYLEVFDQEQVDHPQNNQKVLRGEASPMYFSQGEYTASKIKTWLPDIKLIVLLRNPIERFVSYLNMMKNIKKGIQSQNARKLTQLGPYKRSLHSQRPHKTMVIRQIQRLNIYEIILVSNANDEDSRDYYMNLWALNPLVPKALDRYLFAGSYDLVMPIWMKMFGEKQLFFRESNEFYQNGSAVMQDLEHFLGVDPLGVEQWNNITSRVYNVNLRKGHWDHRVEDEKQVQHFDSTRDEDTGIPHMSEDRTLQSQEVIALLRDYYRPHNVNLSTQIGGKRFEGWDY